MRTAVDVYISRSLAAQQNESDGVLELRPTAFLAEDQTLILEI
jgi:hypothetical protein